MASAAQPCRWGILGTANIARAQFLPAVAAAGGVAAAVASREAATAERYAAEHGIGRGIGGYQALIDDPAVDALYIAVPNSLHAQWATAALRAGKPVLCEKPLTGSLTDTEQVLAVARETGTLLWEAFVFPFHAQLEAVRAALAAGHIGELREIQSSFHFQVSRPDNIRLSAALAGGALNDVGCYPIRLAAELFGSAPDNAWGRAVEGGQGVDVESVAVLSYPGDRRLLLSCGLRRPYDTFTRLIGTAGEIRMTNPFHPSGRDVLEITGGREAERRAASDGEPSFTRMISHIQDVLAGTDEPRQLAVDTALPTAIALNDLHVSFGLAG